MYFNRLKTILLCVLIGIGVLTILFLASMGGYMIYLTTVQPMEIGETLSWLFVMSAAVSAFVTIACVFSGQT
jgi:hypothetical protein